MAVFIKSTPLAFKPTQLNFSCLILPPKWPILCRVGR